MSAMTRSVGICLFPEVEVLDFAGPYEVFTTASRVAPRLRVGPDPFQVFTLSRGAAPVRARAGLEVMADFPLHAHPPIDVLVVPGGVVGAELEHAALIDWIAQVHVGTTVTASVCTGAFLLAKAGLLRGRAATTHWEDIADLRAMFPDVQVQAGPRWVDEGRVVTSAGISAGIDMSLHLVHRLAGRRLAEAAARQMDVAWNPDPATA